MLLKVNNMYRLLFVCTGNTCRSPMLEVLVKQKLKALDAKIEVKSAGLSVREGDSVSLEAREALKKYGAVIRHKPTALTKKALERADTVITMTREQKEYLSNDKCFYKVFAMREVVGFDISDPYGCGAASYGNCAYLLDRAAEIIVKNLKEAGKI